MISHAIPDLVPPKAGEWYAPESLGTCKRGRVRSASHRLPNALNTWDTYTDFVCLGKLSWTGGGGGCEPQVGETVGHVSYASPVYRAESTVRGVWGVPHRHRPCIGGDASTLPFRLSDSEGVVVVVVCRCIAANHDGTDAVDDVMLCSCSLQLWIDRPCSSSIPVDPCGSCALALSSLDRD